jgi:hypothetical protein
VRFLRLRFRRSELRRRARPLSEFADTGCADRNARALKHTECDEHQEGAAPSCAAQHTPAALAEPLAHWLAR